MPFQELRDVFRGKGEILLREVRRHVENNTGYLKKHMSKSLLPQEGQGVKVNAIKADGKKRRAKTYPDDVKIVFL